MVSVHYLKNLLFSATLIIVLVLLESCSRDTTGPSGGAGFSISGTVIDVSGKGMEGMTITVSGGKRVIKGITRENGSFILSGFINGTYVLTVRDTRYCLLPDSVSIFIANSDRIIEPLIAVTPGAVHGKIADSGGKGFPGISLTLIKGGDLFQSVSDSTGRFIFSGLADGIYTLKLSNAAYRFNQDRVEVNIVAKHPVLQNFIAFENNHNLSKNVDFYNFSIHPSDPLKVYSFTVDLASLAEQYRASGMPWFAPTSVDYSILDSNMIPVFHDTSGEPYYIATDACHTAFAFYRYYIEDRNERNKQLFLTVVQWLLDQRDEHSYIHYQYTVEHPYDVYTSPGWISAMAQGEALAAVSMAYNLTGDLKYLEAARGFFNTLTTNTSSLWCFGVDSEGYYWLEEYPVGDFCHVLNGMMFAIWGLWDYYVITKDQVALKLFKAGIKTIADHYSSWKIPGAVATRYCWHYENYCGDTYQYIHLYLMEYFGRFFSVPELLDAATLFRTK